jgi:hypothetical protein
MVKPAILVTAVLLILALGPVAGARGKHVGDAKPIEVEVIYLDPPGTLTIDETGMVYHFPAWNLTYQVSREYDEEFYGIYPVYFIGQTLEFEVRIRNTSNRTYRNLKVVAIQEYHLAPGTEYGEAMPGDSVEEWYVEELGPGGEVVLLGRHHAVLGTVPGLNQTHVQIFHWSNGNQISLGEWRGGGAPGRLFWDDPEAGVYCPPAFAVIG